MPDGAEAVGNGSFPVEEGERCFRHLKKSLFRPAPGGDEQSVGQYRIRVGHARLEPRPVRPAGAVEALHQPLRRGPGDRLQGIDVFHAGRPEMAPGQNYVGLRSDAAQVGQRRQDRFDQLPGQGAVVVGQAAAKDFG